MRRSQGYPHPIGQSTHMPKPDIKGAEIAYPPQETASCVILCRKRCELLGTTPCSSLQPLPNSPAYSFAPSFPCQRKEGTVECSMEEDYAGSKATAAVVPILPFCSRQPLSAEGRVGWKGELQMR